jgi:hypothetical protein
VRLRACVVDLPSGGVGARAGALRVTRRATAAIPAPIVSGWSSWHHAYGDGVYAPIPSTASGLYVIASKRGQVALYVGLSWTNRLRRTCIRHFQAWQQDYRHPQPRQTYDREKCVIAWLVIKGGKDAVHRAEAEAIQLLRPRDNYSRPVVVRPEDGVPDVAPF